MKKLLLFVFVLFLTGNLAQATEVKTNDDVIGEWKYEVPSAPYGYNAGTIVIEEKEGQLAGHIKLDDGYKIDLKEIAYSEEGLKCGLYVDYNYVTLKLKVDGENMKGMVSTPEGEMPITAKKVK
ncbi:hypothetical protein [Draconibacterium halophilum]|uniref:Extracellular endo-alpha-(1->5)-L-arabinanase C-terminal domain-containing protein n=1 Tax=Draconibacterium halophilum TaxID=2706887 RepID=A0A6C0REB0_9BACT|nr:hypothetical protein [Draconibacterium halophilum]QIA07843.1 hypothetical protein G0Q07_08930 [Draconibacterium halophilum]